MDFENIYKYTRQLQVLFIEDNKSFQEETAEIFNQIFKQVDLCNDGEDALIRYKKFNERNNRYYDLIITDICMPKLDGVELTKNIYTINPDQTIIILSAHTEPEYLLEFVNLGIEHFLLKPINFEHMLEVFYKTSQKILSDSIKNETKITTINLNQEYSWDTLTSNLYFNKSLIKLTSKEQKLLQLFVKNKHKITSINEILYLLWENSEDLATKENLKPIISRLRKKIPSLTIEAIYNLGYRLVF